LFAYNRNIFQNYNSIKQAITVNDESALRQLHAGNLVEHVIA
jgi:hypothetical protein